MIGGVSRGGSGRHGKLITEVPEVTQVPGIQPAPLLGAVHVTFARDRVTLPDVHRPIRGSVHRHDARVGRGISGQARNGVRHP
ncbi:hypothetical protein GCM10010844_29120 [Deinococcus radiotolerans]|uniref:Uncharacterized protein n=1 Tax=Deinococcus radiotolerans TaxID=1309407 RepID=A0ABQ2FN00_9DEIO|nr:hypothetical protein GCM10010844_29120 [Deinococcus radiotolerans]